MFALVFAASFLSPNCVAFAHDARTIQRCDGRLLRLGRIETPEPEESANCSALSARARTWCDTSLAVMARGELEIFLSSGAPTIWYTGQRDLDGAFLVSISVNGVDAGHHMIELGLARRLTIVKESAGLGQKP